MALIGTLWHELMAKRGPKPVNLGLLCTLEFEFYKAFHSLRDGTPLPIKGLPPSGLAGAELKSFIRQLRRMTPEHYWLTTRRLAVEMGERLNLARKPLSIDRWWAEREKENEIRWLEMEVNPPGIEALDRRRKIWEDLVNAGTYAALRKACGRWSQLADVRRTGTTVFPRHIVRNAGAFFKMKENERFPRSSYGDDARLDYLARGMAGALSGVSPMTAIERLRNMKHNLRGPLWVTRQGNYLLPERERYCGCWRCSIKNSNKVERIAQTSYENGLKLFMELAKTTKVPSEWRAKGAIQPL